MSVVIEKYVSEEEIQRRVAALGAQISKDYEGQTVILVAVLTGSFVFCADLLRHITCPVKLEFISITRENDRNGSVRINYDLKTDLLGNNVILVEDIVDTGATVKNLMEILSKRSPKTLKLCTFLYKPAYNKHKVPIDYMGFEIEDKFVVGYGLDRKGYHRELPYVGVYGES